MHDTSNPSAAPTVSQPAKRLRPWLRKRSRPLGREDVLLTERPEVQICIYPDIVILTRRDTRTHQWTSYPVNPSDLARTLGKIPSTSGLLVPNIIATGHVNGKPWYVMYVPPQVTNVRVARGDNDWTTYPIQTPPLVWCGHDTTYHIWALSAEGFPTGRAPLYRAPFPNTYEEGGICWGSGDRPGVATPTNMLPALNVFLQGSRFNSHGANNKSKTRPANVVALYELLGPETPYPLDDLLPAKSFTVDWLVGGGPWARGSHMF